MGHLKFLSYDRLGHVDSVDLPDPNRITSCPYIVAFVTSHGQETMLRGSTRVNAETLASFRAVLRNLWTVGCVPILSFIPIDLELIGERGQFKRLLLHVDTLAYQRDTDDSENPYWVYTQEPVARPVEYACNLLLYHLTYIWSTYLLDAVNTSVDKLFLDNIKTPHDIERARMTLRLLVQPH